MKWRASSEKNTGSSALPRVGHWQRLLERVFRLRLDFRSGAQKLHESFTGGLTRSILEKLGRSFHHTDFFCDCGGDPLVQRHTIFFREPLGSLLDGKWELQWIGGFAYDFTFFNTSDGRNTEILNRSASPAKSATLYAASASARPLLKNSPGVKKGDHRG